MRKLSILMIGWEYPPFNSGGLGVACQAIAESIIKAGHNLVFILPQKQTIKNTMVPIYFSDESMANKVDVFWFGGYGDFYKNEKRINENNLKHLRQNNSLFSQVYNYSVTIKELIQKLHDKYKFDLIHCHDWLTVEAGLVAKNIIKKPLILHIHSTEYDRTGGSGGNEYIKTIEKMGLVNADKVIAVSNYTKKIIMQEYNIPQNKIISIHNGINENTIINSLGHFPYLENKKNEGNKIILFLGRLTIQKGVDFLLEALPLIYEQYPNSMTVIAGSGDSEFYLIDKCFQLNIQDKVIFTGFVRDNDRQSLFSLADVFVVPSVSEPFGLTPLEAASYNIPVVLSKQSGASEILKNSFLVDFWDKEKMAEQIIQILKYEPLSKVMKKNAKNDINNQTWEKAVGDYCQVYQSIL